MCEQREELALGYVCRECFEDSECNVCWVKSNSIPMIIVFELTKFCRCFSLFRHFYLGSFAYMQLPVQQLFKCNGSCYLKYIL